MKTIEKNTNLLQDKNKDSQELNDYDQKYYSDMLLFKIIWTILTGVAAIITLGEPFSPSDYLWNYTTICMATITVIYATMFNTPEKLKHASNALKNNKILVHFSLFAVISVILVICFTREFPLPFAVAVYFGVNLISLLCVIALDNHFSGVSILCILKKEVLDTESTSVEEL